MRNCASKCCAEAGFNPECEKPGLLMPRPLQGALAEDGKRQQEGALGAAGRRPADIYLPRWRAGLPAALDFAATSGLRADLLAQSANDPAAAVVQYEGFKEGYLDTKTACAAEGIHFIPMVVDACGGGWGPQACVVWKELAKSTALATGELASSVATRLSQSLGLVLCLENARAGLRRAPGHNEAHTSAAAAAAGVVDG